MADAAWARVRGTDLIEAYEARSLRDILPSQQAIYAWQRSLRPTDVEQSSPDAFIEYLNRVLRATTGEIRGEMITHALHLGSTLKIQGRGLTATQEEVMSDFLRSPNNRRWLARYLGRLAPHSTSLYVGETNCLPERIGQHLGGLSDFGQAVEQAEGLHWTELDLMYAQLGPSSDGPPDVRRTLEYITAVVTLSPLTKRPG